MVLSSSPDKDSEQKLLLDCCKFCEAAYSYNDEDKTSLADFEIEDFCNWERLSNRAISFTTTTPLNLSSLHMGAGRVTVVAFRGTSNPSEIREDLKSYKAVPLFTEEHAPAVSAISIYLYLDIVHTYTVYSILLIQNDVNFHYFRHQRQRTW